MRVRRAVTRPRYGWGDNVTHDHVGEVVGIDGDGDLRLSFPHRNQLFVAQPSECEKVKRPQKRSWFKKLF